VKEFEFGALATLWQPGVSIAFDGTYFILAFPKDKAGWPAIQHHYEYGMGRACLIGKISAYEAGKSFFPIFSEPRKGLYDEFFGFLVSDTTHTARTVAGGVETRTLLTGQDWTVEREFSLKYTPGSEVKFYVDGTLVATHTTNVSAEDRPRHIFCEIGHRSPPYTTDSKLYVKDMYCGVKS